MCWERHMRPLRSITLINKAKVKHILCSISLHILKIQSCKLIYLSIHLSYDTNYTSVSYMHGRLILQINPLFHCFHSKLVPVDLLTTFPFLSQTIEYKSPIV